MSIPHMRPDGVADTTHLAIFLRSQNCYNENDILNDVARFSMIRRETVSVQEPSEAGQQTILRYFAQLRALIPRLDIKESELKTTFGWHDAFAVTKKESHSNFYFDLAACLWNLASFESARAVQVDRSTDEGIRTASRYFQQAAGYIEHLKEHILPNLAASSVSLPCLSENCLNMVKQLLLAQAQLCFYEKAVRDKKKDSMKSNIIAKLALQTSAFYSSASVATRASPLGTVLDMSWFAITDFQAKCFLGAAEYWQALAAKEQALQRGQGYGEEVARFNRAEQHIRSALNVGRQTHVTSALTSVADSLLSVILTSRNSAIHDLSTVYMEAIPSDSSLAEIVPVPMVKPSTLPDLSALLASEGTGSQTLFRYVLPRPVIEANRQFYESVNSLYTSSQTNATNAMNLGKSTLSSVGLPGSLEVVKPENPLPEMLWQKIAKVQTMGGLDRLRSLLDDVKNSARRAVQSMSMIEDTLGREERTDESFHSRYSSYAASLSSTLNQDIRVNLRNLKTAYDNAQTQDEQLTQSLFSPNTINTLVKLSQTREQLQAQFPQSTAEALGSVDLLDIGQDRPQMSPVATQLEEALHLLAGIFETRQQTLQRLQALTQVDLLEVIQQTLQNGNSSVASIHSKYQGDAQQLVQEVQSSITQQEQLLSRILQLNDAFVQSKIHDPLAKARNAIIQSLEEAVVMYFQIHGQILSGQSFYSNLQSKLTTLQQSADDLAYTQQWQRQEYEQSLMDIAAQQHQQLQQQQQQQQQQDQELARRLSQQHLNTDIYGNVPSLTTSTTTGSTAHSGIAVGTPVTVPPHVSTTVGGSAYGNYPAVPYPAAAASTPTISPPAPVPPVNAYQYNSHAYLVSPPSNAGPVSASHAPTVLPAPTLTVGVPAPLPTTGFNPYPLPTPAVASAGPTSAAAHPAAAEGPAGAPVPVAVPPDYHPKIDRLVEMGFSRVNATNALLSSGGDEELALTMLLSAASGGDGPGTVPTSAPGPAVPAGPAPPKPARTAGGFFTWGKK